MTDSDSNSDTTSDARVVAASSLQPPDPLTAELPQDLRDAVDQRVEERWAQADATSVRHANLDACNLQVPGQKYALISFVSPHGRQRAGCHALRIYGTFETMDAARAWAADLSRDDDTFDIYAVDLYKWLAWHPDPNEVDENVDNDETLNSMLIEHRKTQQRAREYHAERTRWLQETSGPSKSIASADEDTTLT